MVLAFVVNVPANTHIRDPYGHNEGKIANMGPMSVPQGQLFYKLVKCAHIGPLWVLKGLI